MNEWTEREVAFFGKLTAGITHELKNVLAIIRESAGLMEDIMSISPDAVVSYHEKFETSLGKIKDQIKRGIELTDRLNKFAHSSDKRTEKIELHNTIEQLVALAQRFAKLKNVTLNTDLSERLDQSAFIETHPVQLQMALFAAIECCLSAMPDGGVIHIGIDERKEQNAVYILCKGDLPDGHEFAGNLRASDKWPALKEIAAFLKGSVECDESEYSIVLFLPDEVSR